MRFFLHKSEKNHTFAVYFQYLENQKKLEMKKLCLLFALCCAMMAHADTYKYLVFTNQTGTTTAFALDNLILKLDGADLQVTNNEGSVNFVLTDLASMQFSMDGTTSVENVLNADAPVQVYTLTGVSLGTYPSMFDAVKNMNAGTYVISTDKISQTIVVK